MLTVGIPLAIEKCEGPNTLLAFLGFELDIVKMQIRLPEEKKKHKMEKLILGWEKKKSCTKHQLDSLIGQLQHASAVVMRRECVYSPIRSENQSSVDRCA